jgi:hypothetical protein
MWSYMGQSIAPISITYFKQYIRKTPLLSGLSLWTQVSWVSPGLLNKLASPKLLCPISLSETPCNISGVFVWDLEWCFHLITGAKSLAYQEGWPCQVPTDHVDPRGRSLSHDKLRRQVLVTQKNPERLRNQFKNPTHQTGKNLGSNSGLP